MEKLKYALVDFIKSLIIGTLSSSVIAMIFTLVGLVITKGSLVDALVITRTGILLMGAIGLFICAGLFLKKSSLRPLENNDGWKNHFKVLNLGYVILALFIGIILTGGLVDIILYNMVR